MFSAIVVIEQGGRPGDHLVIMTDGCAPIFVARQQLVTPAEIQQAMDSVPRPMTYTPWWAISTLRPSLPPVRLSEPVSGAVVASEAIPAPAAPECDAAIPEASTAAERLGGVTMRLDISVWRLPYVWRLVVSFVARRLGR